ncbi:hypothetical protein SO694_00135074 [Aureococcus anophagefferens]|uniref:Uncharacterized protein n=1 Tax=Aureococcus anophagefferens TaxID=44056 RepID=A0ABR1GG53_AURAN
MNFEGEIETQVSDQIAAGRELRSDSGKFAPKTLFTRWTAKGGDPFKATATYNVAAATAEVDVEYEIRVEVQRELQLACAQLITTADASRDFTVDGRKLKLAPSHDFASGVSSVTSNLALSPATTVEAKLNSNLGNSDAPTGTLSIDHTIDSIYSIKHSFALDSGSARVEFRRQARRRREALRRGEPGPFRRDKLIVALAMLGTASAGKYDNTWSVDIKDAAVKNIEGVNLEGEVETQVSDQLGGRDGGDPLAVTATYNVQSQGAEIDVEYEKSGTTIEANFDTAGDNLLTNVEASRDVTVKGRTVNVAPAYNFVSKVASLTSNLAPVPTVPAPRRTSTPAPSSTAADAELTVAANPGKSIEIEWDDAGSKGLWTTNVQMPWGKPVGASVSFKRKFSL